LLKGNILAIKGIGGTHLACRVDDPGIVEQLRSRKGDRKRKPFALMSFSLDQIYEFAEIPSDHILSLLTSPRRPIILLPKRNDYSLAENIAPNLHNVGVMLPYSGFHYLLLNHPKLKTLVMTSANRSHLPIQVENKEILHSLKNVADYFILHNREIYQRNDDSVSKPFIFTQHNQGNNFFLRRSRGYTPEPLECPLYKESSHLLGLGAELHTTAALLSQGKLFLTQHIGNLRYEPTYRFYQSAIRHLQNLLQNPPLAAIAHDLHPLYLSTEFANDLKTTTNVPSMAFQHHYAHGASLLVDNQLWDEEVIIVVADGLGYGTDGNIWGGELLQCSFQDFNRADHLAYVVQPGGDLSTKFPYRMLLSYLKSAEVPEEEILNIVSDGDNISPGLVYKDARIILQQIDQKFNSPLTSSTGRFLDACSAALGFCSEASYEGEPAIVLEGYGWSARHTTTQNPFIRESLQEDLRLNISPIIPRLVELMSTRTSKNELAWHIQEFIGWSFANAVLDLTEKEGIITVGFTGGVAYNDLILRSFIHTLQEEAPQSVNVLLHRNLPPGDGGIAAGQAALLAHREIVK
jgi:hydrogenase maturation protein HypF